MKDEASSSTERLETLAIHGGQRRDPNHGAVMEPIVLSSTFAQPAPGEPLRFDYSRSGNPTRAALESALAALENGKRGFAFSSGCGAALTLLSTLQPGDHVLCSDDVYGGTYRLLTKVIAKHGIGITFADLRSMDELLANLQPSTKMLWLETPSNPMLKLVDLKQAAEIASASGIRLVVDNTFASPVLQQPLLLGASVVLHSTTKYINGHSDVVGGALVTNDEELAQQVAFLQNALGAVPSPMDCYLVLRGLKTLPVRMRQHVESASELATRLERAPWVERVHYPGLPSHPQHDLAQRQMRGPGGMISLELATELEGARKFLQALHVFTLAESLGGVESLAEHPALMTHASIPREVREALGIREGLVRLSVGLEHVEDLWIDLENAARSMEAP